MPSSALRSPAPWRRRAAACGAARPVTDRRGDRRPHGLGGRVLVGGRHRRVPGRQHGRRVAASSVCGAGLGDDVAVGVGDVDGQVDLERTERLEELGQPLGVDDLDLVERQAEQRLGLRLSATRRRRRATVSAIGSRSSPLPPLASALTGTGIDAAARRRTAGPTSTAIDASWPSSSTAASERRSASPGTPAPGRRTRRRPPRSSCTASPRRATPSPTAADDRADGGTGGDEGRAAATAGEGRHPSLPYRPRSSMTCSTGSVTR